MKHDIKVVVFGKKDALYTKMVVFNLNKLSINFDLILESDFSNKKKSIFFFSKLKKLLNSGYFKPLSVFHWFTWFLLFEKLINRNNQVVEEIKNRYKNVKLIPNAIFSNLNSNDCIVLLKKKKYDYALFSSVGIISKEVINQINVACINAHPAPLPECRGGGAIVCTFFKMLPPSVSVHIATEEIDKGDIFSVKSIKLQQTDNIVTISARLTEMCSIELTNIINKIINKQYVKIIKNDGVLNYWKDWSYSKQIKARKNFKLMLKNLKYKK